MIDTHALRFDERTTGMPSAMLPAESSTAKMRLPVFRTLCRRAMLIKQFYKFCICVHFRNFYRLKLRDIAPAGNQYLTVHFYKFLKESILFWQNIEVVNDNETVRVELF